MGGGGWDVTGGGVSIGIGTGVGIGVTVGAGAMIGGSGIGGCDCDTGVLGEITGPTLVVIATATVIGALVCPVGVGGGGDETSTIRAVLLGFVSGDGSGFGGGLSP